MAAKRTTVRLERGVGPSRVFWEITREGVSVRMRYGRHLNAGRTSAPKTYSSVKEADAACAVAIAAKREEGYADPVVRAEAGTTSQKGVSARSPELEAAIEEDPNDATGYLVYADWLQQQGDPRGELIIAQHGMATSDVARDVTRFERDQAALFKKFGAELLGPLAGYTFLRNSMRSFRTFSWRHGFIRAARLGPLVYTHFHPAEVLAFLFAHPSGRFLERLIVGQLDSTSRSLLETIERHAPKTLDSLVVGDCSDRSALLGWVWRAFKGLRRLLVVGRIESFGTFDAPNLESLTLTLANEANLPVLLQARLPALRSLRIALTSRFEIDDVIRLLDAFPKLEHLRVRCWSTWTTGNETRLVHRDELALRLVRAAATRRLPRLDLEIPISDRAADAIIDTGHVRGIDALHVPTEAVPDHLHGPLAAAANLVWTETPDEDDLDLDEIDVSPR